MAVIFATATALNSCATAPSTSLHTDVSLPAIVPDAFVGEVEEKTTPAFDWFEDFHVIDRVYNLGIVSSAQTHAIEVYSAFRYTVHDWTSFVNNGGATNGLSVPNLPILPRAFPPQSGLNLTLSVSASGDPLVDTTLDFGFDNGGTAFVSVVLQRVAPFILRPEVPYRERLEWLTDVIEHADGTEQRVSVRKNPRQYFEWDLIHLDGVERSKFHHFLFGQQAGVIAIAVWRELVHLATAVSGGATLLTITPTTDYSDFRVGGQVLVYEDEDNFDILGLAAKTSTTLTLTTGTTQSFTTKALIVPIRVGVIEGSVSGGRFPTVHATSRARVRITDNDVSLASTSGFSSFNSKVLFDDCNIMVQVMPEDFEQRVIVLDNGTGLSYQISPWSRHKRVSQKGFVVRSGSELWSLRGVLHALRGRQVSFYLPTFSEDLQADANLVSGAATLTIVNVGYTKYVGTTTPLQPRNVIRVVFNDGNPSLIRTVVSASELSVTQEQLVLNATWPSTFTPSQVKRIEYIEEVRLDNDDVVLAHDQGWNTRVFVPVRAVFE